MKTSELLPHQQRVVTERDELEKKFKDLVTFILENPIFVSLPDKEQEDLNLQQELMGKYIDVLNRRIARFYE